MRLPYGALVGAAACMPSMAKCLADSSQHCMSPWSHHVCRRAVIWMGPAKGAEPKKPASGQVPLRWPALISEAQAVSLWLGLMQDVESCRLSVVDWVPFLHAAWMLDFASASLPKLATALQETHTG